MWIYEKRWNQGAFYRRNGSSLSWTMHRFKYVLGKKRRPRHERRFCEVALDAVKPKPSNDCPPSSSLRSTFNIFSRYLTARIKQNRSYLEKSTYGGIKSALGNMFRMSGQYICLNTIDKRNVSIYVWNLMDFRKMIR